MYRLAKSAKQACILAISRVPWALQSLPIRFKFRGGDISALQQYIDALVTRDKATALRFESANLVYDVEYNPPQTEGHKRHMLRIDNFLEFLSLTDELCVPLFDRINFVTDGTKLVPATYIRALSAHLPELDPEKEWRWVRKEDDLPTGTKPEDVHSGMYLRSKAPPPTAPEPARREEEGKDEAEEDAPQEHEISRKCGEKHVDLMTVTHAEKPYYTRRIFTYSGEVIYAATAWSAAGPWSVSVRNNSLLLAYNVMV
jgi:hypothetical protein